MVIGIAAVAVAGIFVGPAIVRHYVDRRIEASEGKHLPAFDLPLAAGEGSLSSEELLGRYVLLNFMRSRCSSCLAEAPELRALAAELPDDAELVSVMTDRVLDFPSELTAETLARHAYSHRVVLADAGLVEDFHGLGWAHVTPVTYVVAPDGRIVDSLRGHQTAEALRTALDAARSGSPR